jgi:hypothetical protein
MRAWMSSIISKRQLLWQPIVVHASENSVAIVYFSAKQTDMMIDKQQCDLNSESGYCNLPALWNMKIAEYSNR